MNSYIFYEIKRRWLYCLNRLGGEDFHYSGYAGGLIYSAQEGNRIITDMILSGRPFTATRFGKTEMDPLIYRERNRKNKRKKEMADRNIGVCSGFFPCTDAMIDKYRNVFIDSIGDIDLLGVYFFIDNEEYFIDKYMNKPKCCLPRALEPFYFESPWTSALRGKRVLVIHPFSRSIEKQYIKREKLFENKNILPDFELKTIKAVQTLADEKDSRFTTWFEALDWMKSEISKVDFDIALLGCGAYGIPLQHYIKSLGKQSVYVGGGLQILFGIKGKRWDDHPEISKLYNDSWVRADDSEIISNYRNVEQGGPYW